MLVGRVRFTGVVKSLMSCPHKVIHVHEESLKFGKSRWRHHSLDSHEKWLNSKKTLWTPDNKLCLSYNRFKSPSPRDSAYQDIIWRKCKTPWGTCLTCVICYLHWIGVLWSTPLEDMSKTNRFATYITHVHCSYRVLSTVFCARPAPVCASQRASHMSPWCSHTQTCPMLYVKQLMPQCSWTAPRHHKNARLHV